MKTTQKLLLVAAVALIPTTAWSQVMVCDGETVQICESVVAADGSSVVADAQEHDSLSPNDPLGGPTITSEGGNLYSVCVGITNTGGDLSGPNGEVQNGGSEGGCIEVLLEIDITITTTITIGPVSVTAATVRDFTSGPTEVCPGEC